MRHVCNKISFAIKNTNWCNLRCAHCCESSGPDVVANIMPLQDVEKYIAEFNAMPLPKWEHMVFTGGEAMAPYFHKQMEYIPQCLNIAASYGMVPFVKTNGVWGMNDELRHQILRDLANVAHRHNLMMSLDISVDAFHNNTNAVFNILNDIVRSDYLAPAIRVSLVSLNDKKSHMEFMYLLDKLRINGLDVDVGHDGMFTLWVPYVRGVHLYYDLRTNISNIGRAAENKLGKFVPNGRPSMDEGHCFQIDNSHIATLNYKYSTPVNGRSMLDVVKELMAKVR